MEKDINPKGFKISGIVNWGTIWGLIFAVIALDLYADFRKQKTVQEAQLQITARQVDSLRAVKNQLDQQLYTMRAALTQYQTGTGTIEAGSETMAKTE